MYVYKKKCDEEYYLSIIQATQQQFMFQNQPNFNYMQPRQQQYYNSFPGGNYFNNNYYNPYITPENRNYTQSFNNSFNHQNNLNPISPSPILSKNENKYGYHDNGNRKHIMEDQILYNKLNSINEINNKKNSNFENFHNNEYENIQKNNFFEQKNNNKKVFKLEDFLSGNKKSNLNYKFNRVSNDEFN